MKFEKQVSPWAVFLALTLFGQPFDQFGEFSFDGGKRQGGLWLGSQKEADVMGLGQFMAVPANRLPHKPLDPVSTGRISDGPLNRNQESGLLQLRAQGLRGVRVSPDSEHGTDLGPPGT